MALSRHGTPMGPPRQMIDPVERQIKFSREQNEFLKKKYGRGLSKAIRAWADEQMALERGSE